MDSIISKIVVQVVNYEFPEEYLWSLGVYFRSSPSCRGYLQIFWTGVSKKPAMEMSIICWRRRQASKKCLYLPNFMRRCSSAQAAGCVLQ